MLRHHVNLTLETLADYSLLCLCCLELLGEVADDLLMPLLNLLQLVLPFPVFLHHLETAALAQLVDALHLLGHLAELLERLLLQQLQLLGFRLAHEFVERHLLLVSTALDLQGVLLQPSEHVSEEVEILLAFLLKQAPDMVHLDERLLGSARLSTILLVRPRRVRCLGCCCRFRVVADRGDVILLSSIRYHAHTGLACSSGEYRAPGDLCRRLRFVFQFSL